MVSQSICLQTWWFFLGVGCMHPCVVKEKQHFGDLRPSGSMNQYAFCCAERFLVTQASLSRHICNQHVCCICHLWSSALTLKNIPGLDSHTLTDAQPHRRTAKHRHGYSRPVLTKCFPLTGQFVWFLFLFYCIRIDVLDFYGVLHCHYALCNQWMFHMFFQQVGITVIWPAP